LAFNLAGEIRVEAEILARPPRKVLRDNRDIG